MKSKYCLVVLILSFFISSNQAKACGAIFGALAGGIPDGIAMNDRTYSKGNFRFRGFVPNGSGQMRAANGYQAVSYAAASAAQVHSAAILNANLQNNATVHRSLGANIKRTINNNLKLISSSINTIAAYHNSNYRVPGMSYNYSTPRATQYPTRLPASSRIRSPRITFGNPIPSYTRARNGKVISVSNRGTAASSRFILYNKEAIMGHFVGEIIGEGVDKGISHAADRGLISGVSFFNTKQLARFAGKATLGVVDSAFALTDLGKTIREGKFLKASIDSAYFAGGIIAPTATSFFSGALVLAAFGNKLEQRTFQSLRNYHFAGARTPHELRVAESNYQASVQFARVFATGY